MNRTTAVINATTVNPQLVHCPDIVNPGLCLDRSANTGRLIGTYPVAGGALAIHHLLKIRNEKVGSNHFARRAIH